MSLQSNLKLLDLQRADVDLGARNYAVSISNQSAQLMAGRPTSLSLAPTWSHRAGHTLPLPWMGGPGWML